MPFVILPWAVLDNELLSAHDVLVYATIARYADWTTGVAWPSRKTVADLARCDIKTVDRSIGRLVSSGFLEKHKRKHELGESNVYIVHEIVAQQETLKPRSRGRDSNGATLGTQTGRPLGTQTGRELELLQLHKAERSEWTGVPDDVRAQVAALQGGTP
jgi:DNA-binding transcriptional MocR family regulator